MKVFIVPEKSASYISKRPAPYRITESQNVRGWKGPLWII